MGLLTLLGLALGSYLVRRSRRPRITLLDPNEKYLLRLLDKTVSCGVAEGTGVPPGCGWDAPGSWRHQTCLVRRLSSILQTVNHNTKRFRFALPTAHHVLGLPVGKNCGVGSFPWYSNRVSPFLGSPETRCFSLVPSHPITLSTPGCLSSRL